MRTGNNKDNANSASSGSSSTGGVTSELVDSVDQMVKLPFKMTGATWDLMMQGVRSISGGADSGEDHGSDWSAAANGSSSNSGDVSSSSSSTTTSRSSNSTMSGLNNQDLSGDDLKYVVWSIVFTKPGFECVLEPQHSEIVNYSADGSSFAALKIAKMLEKARHGHVAKSEMWEERGYPPESVKAAERRTDVIITNGAETTVASTSGDDSMSTSRERGWRIPAEDQKYITFIYRVDWRLPKQEEVVRVERVTIERGATTVRG